MDRFSQLRAAGFNDTEINDYLSGESAKLLSAGFSQDEVKQYLGAPPEPNDGAIRKAVETNLSKAATGADGQKTPLTFSQAVEAGFQGSVGVPGLYGLASRNRMPDLKPTGDESTVNEYAYQIAQAIGDVPAMIAGGALAGGAGAETGPGAAIFAAGGAMAMPAALRATMIDAFQKGEFHSPGEFMQRASGILMDTAKGWLTGVSGGAAGAVAGKVLEPVAAPVIKTVGQTASELAAMVAVGKTLDGEPIHMKDFVDGGVVLMALKGAHVVTGKFSSKAAEVGRDGLMDIYKKTGVQPPEVLSDAKSDPTIVQDIAAGKFPKAYEDRIDPMFQPVEEGASSGTTPTTTDTSVATGRQALETMAANLGIEVKTTNDGRYYSSSQGHIAVPPEVGANLPEGITDPDFVFAHELGHAILVTRRGVNFSRESQDGKFSKWSEAKLRREIPNWDELIDASKEMKPDFWNRPELGQQEYAARADEIVADAIASVLKGKRDISMLEPLMKMVGMKPEGLGLASGGGGKGPNGMPLPAAGAPEPGSLGEAQKTLLEKVNIGGENQKQPMTFDKMYTAALDDLHPISEAVDAMAKGKDIPADQNPYVMARLLRGVYGKAQQALENSTFDFTTLKNNGKSLKAILDPVKDDVDGLRAYAIASRAMELKDRHLVSGFDVDAAAKVIKESGDKFEPVMRELVDYQNRITAYLRDAGVLDKQAYAAMIEANKSYVPFYRIFENQMPNGGAGAGLKTRNPIKGFKGSGMDIVDPIESIIKNTYTYLTLADRNAVGKSFYDLGLKSGNAEEFFTKQPPNLRPTTVTDQEMGNFLRENGIEQMPPEALTVFRAVRQPLAPDEIGFFNEGKWTVLKLSSPELAEAFKATDQRSANMLMQFLSAPAKLLRAGSTLSPDFMPRNFVRDQFSAFVNSKVGFVPIYDTLVGAAHLIKKDDVFQDWLKSGGANATLVALDRRYIQSEITKLTGQDQAANFLEKTWNVAKTPVEWLRVTSELIENATRLGEFNRANSQGKAGILEAGLGSREVTLDFARVGTQTKAMNMITAFFNSQVQGVDRTVRTIKDNPLGSMAKIGVAITMPSVLLWMANHDDPRWKEIPGWQRDLFWIVMTKDNIYRIPKPFELGILFGSSVERMLDAVAGKMEKGDVAEFLKTAAGGFVPNLVPTVVSPALEQMTNYSFFSGHQLVPGYLQDPKTGVLPEYRYTEYTSETTKALGHILGTVPYIKDTSSASPIVIDNYLRAWTGGLGSYALQMADAGLRKAKVLPDPVKPESTLADIPVVKAFVVRYPSAQAESIQRFREDYAQSSLTINTMKSLAKQGDFDAWRRVSQINQANLYKLEGIDKALADHNQLIREIYKNPAMPPDQKRQLIDATYYNMIQMTQMGNEMLKQIKPALSH